MTFKGCLTQNPQKCGREFLTKVPYIGSIKGGQPAFEKVENWEASWPLHTSNSNNFNAGYEKGLQI